MYFRKTYRKRKMPIHPPHSVYGGDDRRRSRKRRDERRRRTKRRW
jgi:hypothetical protein